MKVFIVVAVLLNNGAWVQGPVGVLPSMEKCEQARGEAIDKGALEEMFGGLDVREYHAVCVRSRPVTKEEQT